MSLPSTTQAYKLTSFDKSLDGLVLERDVAVPSQLAPTEVLVELHAVSLNARDYQSECCAPLPPHIHDNALAD